MARAKMNATMSTVWRPRGATVVERKAQMSDSKHVTYEDAGVDTAEGGRAVDAIKQMVKDTNRPEVIGGIGGFGGLFSAAALKDMEDPILISGTDGVGTKLVLAQIMDRHETVGQDLVAMCVNDILASGAEPLFFLDYVAIGHIEAEHMAKIIKGVADGCKLAGCALVGGEMAEHPGVMAPADYDLAGFTVGVVDRPKMLDPANVRPGDVILGLPSTGVHSNGYSLVRKVIGVDGIKPGTPEAAAKAEELSRPLEELGGASLCWLPRASTSSRFWSCSAVVPTCTPLPTSPAAASPRTSTARLPTTSTPWSPATAPRWAGMFRPSSPTCRVRPSSRPTRHARPSTWASACA